ncbi:centromere/kinetochore protein-like protein zw10 [Halenospora varia]|nr:centromere/kinetochore protein-like protein zw10 [Halenospora varia]
MATTNAGARVGPTLVDFATNGQFPEEEAVSAASVDSTGLPTALEVLNEAKLALETEIKEISRDSAADVDTWITHAKSIQDDIEKSRRLASSIVRQAEADEQRLELLEEKEAYAGFLEKEVAFNVHLGEALRSIQEVNDKLDKAEGLAGEKRIIEAMAVLEDAWTSISTTPPDSTIRAMRILDARSFELRTLIHEQFEAIWEVLIHMDVEQCSLTVNKSLSSEPMNLDQAMVGLKAYNEVESAAKKLWDNLDNYILKPRTELRTGNLPSIQIEENTIRLDPSPSNVSIKALFQDLENVIRFLVSNLPPEFIKPLAGAMMPVLSTRIKELWLDTAVPSSLDDMVDYQKALLQVSEFANKLDSLDWLGTSSFHDWVSNVSKIWLSKKRETSLDWTRNQLALGIGAPRFAEKVETRMVPRDEGHHISATGDVVTDDWDAGWESGEEDNSLKVPEARPPLMNKNSVDEARKLSQTVSAESIIAAAEDEEEDDADDAADAWGWGDEDAAETEVSPVKTKLDMKTRKQSTSGKSEKPNLAGDVREITLSEKYWTSSMPQPVLDTVLEIYEDGARLTKAANETLPVTPAAPGLFSLPTLILAMYRAVSPTYYAIEACGNMYLYNDAMWLSDQLKEFSAKWKQRRDLSDRAYGMVRLDNEIKALEGFGKRAYTNELIAQRTVLRDLLGGAQNFFQQEKLELEHGIKIVVKIIRDLAASWSGILTWSACASAIGTLVNTVATKLITDIFDLTSIGSDDAFTFATVLSKIEELDDLFIKPTDPSRPTDKDKPKLSLAAQFVDKWLKMNYLSQVLQSNLRDIKFLWFDSELSLFLTVEEVVDLIGVSFENNHQSKQTIREIRGNPAPKGVDL